MVTKRIGVVDCGFKKILCSPFGSLSLSKFPCEGCFVNNFFYEGCLVILAKVSLITINFLELGFLKLFIFSLFFKRSACRVVLGSYGSEETLEF